MPYWRLSGFYFFYFATLGALIPYWTLYLKSIGLTAVDIGHLMALLMLSRIIAPNVWAWIADHHHQRMQVVRLASFLTVLLFSGVFFGTQFWWLAAVMLLFSFFWNASLPLIEVTTMNHSGARAGHLAVHPAAARGGDCADGAPGPILEKFFTRRGGGLFVGVFSHAGQPRSLLYLLLHLPGESRLFQDLDRQSVGVCSALRDRCLSHCATPIQAGKFAQYTVNQLLHGHVTLAADRLFPGLPAGAGIRPSSARRLVRNFPCRRHPISLSFLHGQAANS